MALAYEMVPRMEVLPEKPAREKGIITRVVALQTYQRDTPVESHLFQLVEREVMKAQQAEPKGQCSLFSQKTARSSPACR